MVPGFWILLLKSLTRAAVPVHCNHRQVHRVLSNSNLVLRQGSGSRRVGRATFIQTYIRIPNAYGWQAGTFVHAVHVRTENTRKLKCRQL